MLFLRAANALMFHSSQRLATEQDIATLERLREEAHWRKYDEPTYLRRQREEMNDERRG